MHHQWQTDPSWCSDGRINVTSTEKLCPVINTAAAIAAAGTVADSSRQQGRRAGEQFYGRCRQHSKGVACCVGILHFFNFLLGCKNQEFQLDPRSKILSFWKRFFVFCFFQCGLMSFFGKLSPNFFYIRRSRIVFSPKYKIRLKLFIEERSYRSFWVLSCHDDNYCDADSFL